MAQPYIIVNEHSPDDCEAMEAGIPHVPAAWKGTNFYCTCPGGVHGYFMIVEASSAEEVMRLLPVPFRAGTTKTLALEVFQL
jgi:hypothetical protein